MASEAHAWPPIGSLKICEMGPGPQALRQFGSYRFHPFVCSREATHLPEILQVSHSNQVEKRRPHFHLEKGRFPRRRSKAERLAAEDMRKKKTNRQSSELLSFKETHY